MPPMAGEAEAMGVEMPLECHCGLGGAVVRSVSDGAPDDTCWSKLRKMPQSKRASSHEPEAASEASRVRLLSFFEAKAGLTRSSCTP